jgi:hypothetical protein
MMVAVGWPDGSASFAAMKTRRRKTANPKRSGAPKAARTRTPSVADLQREVAALRRELNEARHEQSAASEGRSFVGWLPSGGNIPEEILDLITQVPDSGLD